MFPWPLFSSPKWHGVDSLGEPILGVYVLSKDIALPQKLATHKEPGRTAQVYHEKLTEAIRRRRAKKQQRMDAEAGW